MLTPLDLPVRKPDAEGQGSNSSEFCQDDFEVGSALAELQERCKSVSLEIGGPWAWTRKDRKWTLKWEDHDASTGSIAHENVHIVVREALRRVRVCQEKPIGAEPDTLPEPAAVV
jgi:hypothetical protein